MSDRVNLLVIECQSSINWYEIFEGVKLSDGRKVVIEQATWDDFHVISYDQPGVVVQIRKQEKPWPGSLQNQDRSFQVQFVLLRSVTRSIKGQDSRNKLLGLLHAGLPSVNSLVSAYCCLDRPVMFGQLKKLEKRLGTDKFPLIEQTLYTDYQTIKTPTEFPVVAKVAHPHAGYGKMKFDNNTDNQFEDFISLMAVHNDYVSVEPYIEWDFDIRIQKIGPHYRAFKRISPNWKGNVGNASMIFDLEMTEEYKLMIDESAKVFGGLEICALDLLHNEERGEYILELNDTAIGLVHQYAYEDMCNMRDIVVNRMEKIFVDGHNFDEYYRQLLIDPYLKLTEDLTILETSLRVEREKTVILENKIATHSETHRKQDIRKHPVVWFQSIIIIALLAILFALDQ